MPKSRNNRNKKYDPNKLHKKKMNVEEESYNYVTPPFVNILGKFLLWSFGLLGVAVCIGLLIN